MKVNNKILLVSSSTGGHAIPIFEIYKELVSRKFDVYVIHANSLIEKELFKGAKSYVIRSGKGKHGRIAVKVAESFKLLFSVFQVLIILIRVRPKMIFSKGGFNSIPVLFWAKLIGIPYIIHESDSVIGRANRLYSKNAKTFFVSFPKECYGKNNFDIKYSGLIVRDFFQAKKSNGKKTIFITGGSLGAKVFSNTISSILPSLLNKYKVIYNSGAADHAIDNDCLQKIEKEKFKNYESFSFSYNKMADAISRCDLIITRSGANIIGEIAKLKKASILIPYPYATNNHQIKNAKYLERMGATILIKQDMLTPANLLNRIEYLMLDERNLKVIGENANKSIKHDGKDVIISEILKYMRNL